MKKLVEDEEYAEKKDRLAGEKGKYVKKHLLTHTRSRWRNTFFPSHLRCVYYLPKRSSEFKLLGDG